MIIICYDNTETSFGPCDSLKERQNRKERRIALLDFRIYTFIEVCKYMNFTRAAEQLNITQPTVSQHIRWLENVYGVSLFSYVGKKMALTESGRQILNVATTMVHDEKFLKKAV